MQEDSSYAVIVVTHNHAETLPACLDAVAALERDLIVIGSTRGDPTNVDVAAATARGILVTNVRDYCTEEVADRRQRVLALTPLGQAMLSAVDHARADQFLAFCRRLDWRLFCRIGAGRAHCGRRRRSAGGAVATLQRRTRAHRTRGGR